MKNRSLNRRVRERMQRTGESFSIARMNILKEAKPDGPEGPQEDAPGEEKITPLGASASSDTAEDFDAEDYLDAEDYEEVENAAYPNTLLDDESASSPPDEPDVNGADGEAGDVRSARFDAFLSSLRVSWREAKDGVDADDRIVAAARRLRVLGRCACGEPELDAYDLLEAAETHADMQGEEPSDAQRDELLKLVWNSGVVESCTRHGGGDFDD